MPTKLEPAINIISKIWPLISGLVLGRIFDSAAEFLNRRRAEREGLPVEEEEEPDCPPPGVSTGATLWLTVSGLALGSALGFLASYLLREDR